MFEFHLRCSRTSRKSRRRREVRRRDDARTMFDHTQYGSAADSGAKLLIANWEHTERQVSLSAAISHQLERGMHRRKRAIYARSKYQCEYHSSTSRRCAALLMLAGSWTGRRANANIRHSWDAEDMQRDFLGLLYAGNPDPLEVMKKKELHDLLVEAVYRSENVARTLERIVIKNG